jgi:hypothetical protein
MYLATYLRESLLVVILECSGVDIEVVCEAEVRIVMRCRVVGLKRRELLNLKDGRRRTRRTDSIPILL